VNKTQETSLSRCNFLIANAKTPRLATGTFWHVSCLYRAPLFLPRGWIWNLRGLSPPWE